MFLSSRLALFAERFNAQTRLIAGSPRLNAFTNPDFFLSELFVEEGVLPFLGGEQVVATLQKRGVIARPVEEPAVGDRSSMMHVASLHEERGGRAVTKIKVTPERSKNSSSQSMASISQVVGRLIKQ